MHAEECLSSAVPMRGAGRRQRDPGHRRSRFGMALVARLAGD